MKYKDALDIAIELCNDNNGKLIQHFTQWSVCGSLRREKEFVNDIDIVAIPKAESGYNFGELSLVDHIKQLDPDGVEIAKNEKKQQKRFLNGPKIKRFQYKGIMIDLYLADDSTFETLQLIRTGSTEHNIRLVMLAKQKGLKLFASGKGLCKVNEKDEIIETIENTEDGILQFLLGKVPLPKDRRF